MADPPGLIRWEGHGRGGLQRHPLLHRCIMVRMAHEGSAPLFWNWGSEYQRVVRDRQPHFMTGALAEPFLRKQAKAKDPLKHKLMRAKVVQVQQ
jgi:hypothetical protein